LLPCTKVFDLQQTYQIKLPQFEGPFDLLLFFIERDELDIYNIPIAQLTDDFLAYIKNMESLNIELASEFILFAATLMRIKAKMLLPRRETDAAGNPVDPRFELVDKLLEYKKFKEVSAMLSALEAERMQKSKRGNIKDEVNKLSESYADGTEIQTVTMYKLMHTYEKILKRLNERMNKPQHVVMKYSYSMESQRSYLISELGNKQNVQFEAVFGTCSNKIEAIFTFLALLELIQQQYISIIIGSDRNSFILNWNTDKTPPTATETAP
jgi:segregation and condensation protein A